MKLIHMEFDVGKDEYGRRVTLVREQRAGGIVSWSIKRAASSQLDESAQIYGLTSANLKLMAEAAQEHS